MPIEIPVRKPCPFCRNLRDEIVADEERTKRFAYIQRLTEVAAVVNSYSSSLGHVLVVPVRHAPTVLDLAEEEALSLSKLVRRIAHAVHDAFDPAGLNIFQNNGVASGQSIPHYHVHVVPRYPGDRPELLLPKNATLLPFEERARVAVRIAKFLRA